MPQKLINQEWLASPPPAPYVPGPDVAYWRPSDDVRIVLEVFRHSNGAFGFRYRAWVDWRDAGGELRGCSWHELYPAESLFPDDPYEAQLTAEHHASSKRVPLGGGWRTVAQPAHGN